MRDRKFIHQPFNKKTSFVLFVMLLLFFSCGVTINIGSVDEYKKHEVKNSMNELKDSLSFKLNEIANRSDKLGFGLTILNKDSIFYQKAFGKISKDADLKFTLNTVMPIGSISKTLAGVSIMKAVELGYLTLDDDINKHLSFKIINPYHPDKKITVEHIATHTSTLKYTKHYDKAYIFDSKIPPFYKEIKNKKAAKKEIELLNSNIDMPMDEFVKKIYTKDGEWYKKNNFLKKTPGTQFSYCNENAALAALIIEGCSGKDYKTFVHEYIVLPSRMSQSSWSMSDYDEKDRGQLYYYGQPIPNYKLITYPDGGFVTNITDFTKYFQNLMQGYFGEDNLLSAKSYKVLFEKHFEEDKEAAGIFMELSGNQIGHNGGDPGITTFAYFDKETSFGYILFFKYGMSMSLFDALREVRKHTAYMSVAKD